MNLYARTHKINTLIRYSAASFALFLAAFFVVQVDVHAETVDPSQEALRQKELPIQSNSIPGWPEGPAVTAEAAIVMDVNTKTILYSKNIDEKLFPASTTKIMTCLLAAENAKLNENVVFSHDAIFSVPNDGSNIGIDEGEAITVEQALYGIMVGSANEVANGLAEHVSGSIDKFVAQMNEKAKELGCKNTHFMNTNGLHNDNHYTSAYDLALISSEFFKNELLCRVANTPKYYIPQSPTQPDDDLNIVNRNKFITGEIKCEGLVGGKTGYTDQAQSTLVTCAEKDGMRLVCVVFKEESPAQFYDTLTLLNYGFNFFDAVHVADKDTRYMPDDSLFFESDHDVFGKSGTILNLNKKDYIILPKVASIEDTEYEVSYDISPSEKAKNETAIAKVNYTFSGVPIGCAHVCYFDQNRSSSDKTPEYHSIYINVKLLILAAGIFVILMTGGSSVVARIIANRTFLSKSDRIRYNRRKKEFNKMKSRFKRR
ncbi:MAG: D-alanyl-D-alanine carboxypeptidase [Butyrivibrio sp.]|nr:D-alanyl-D-alanine carboxypeptidase [Butyrivibrio sp.]